ncbi:MAG: hypothetical protein DMG07_11205, partial [Acidobacteria bacterium]
MILVFILVVFSLEVALAGFIRSLEKATLMFGCFAFGMLSLVSILILAGQLKAIDSDIFWLL